MTPDDITSKHISRLLLKITERSTFFAALVLQAKIEISNEVPTAATDGKKIYVSPDFFAKLSIAEQEGVLLHEVLHAALLHVPRRAARDPQIWNIAADIVVNGIVISENYVIPEGGIVNKDLEHLSVEEVYEKLMQNAVKIELSAADLLDAPPSDANPEEGNGKNGKQSDKQKSGTASESAWQRAMEHAKIISQNSGQGKLPARLQREFESLKTPQIDWRSYLWRFLVQTPTDFAAFDRRFVYQDTYLETLDAQNVHVCVCVDTSGSIDTPALRSLASEVRGIAEAYPHLRCDLYYADAELYGPYPIQPDAELPPPQGGGGTDFRPFFERLSDDNDPSQPTVAVYLTDGYGDFPETAPQIPTLWVVTPGGKDLEKFPFGEAVRLLQITV
jgi:predicted metal-dependent peptidase